MTAPAPTTDKPAPQFSVRPLLGILAFLKEQPGAVAVCFLLLLVNIAIEMSLPQIIGYTISGLERRATETFALRTPVLLFLGLVTLRALVGLVLGPIRNRTVQSTLGSIRAAIYNAVQRLAFAYHDKANTGELISRSTTDVWRLQDFLFACLFLSVDIVVALVVTNLLIFRVSTTLGWVAIGTMLPTIALIGYYASRLQPKWRQVDDLHSAMTTVIQENIAGVRVVKAFARESGEIEKFRRKKEVFLDTLMSTVNYWAARVPFAQFIYGLSVPLAVWIGGADVIHGTMRVGDLAKVIFYLMAIGHRVGMVGQFTNIVQHASASAERVLEILREPTLLQDGPRDLPAPVAKPMPPDSTAADVAPTLFPPPPGGGRVEFEHASFHYADNKSSLEDVSFVAEPGETIAIVGPTGAGKSTLVHLIPRFYDVSQGRVRVEGIDVRELKLAPLRRAIGVIFQETFLFSVSAAENIAYGRPGAAREEIEACARAAQAHEFIQELESGYDTVIGERGVSLSGGQRQRIAIARAFLMNPRILILDDATASVDSKTERLIQEAMQRLRANRTTFIIAQRLSTVQHADQILVLDRGRLVARGRHAELTASSAFYRGLFGVENSVA